MLKTVSEQSFQETDHRSVGRTKISVSDVIKNWGLGHAPNVKSKEGIRKS